MNIFQKAAQGLNLTPGERAFLKLCKSWGITAIGSGLVIGGQYLAVGSVDWQRILLASGGTALLSVLHALDKYATAHGDTPLALADEAAMSQVQQRLPQPITFPPTATVPASTPLYGPANLPPIGPNSFYGTLPPVDNTTFVNPQMQTAQVPQQAFPAPVRHFGDSQLMPTVQPPTR